MTVQELIGKLVKLPLDAEVHVRAKDYDTGYYVGVDEAQEVSIEGNIVYIDGDLS